MQLRVCRLVLGHDGTAHEDVEDLTQRERALVGVVLKDLEHRVKHDPPEPGRYADLRADE
ncbi:MAG: hypothetical protein ACXVHQ_30960 [Solirubrobacteraceae bacterium]